ncbi:MAG: hypothetical protein RIQ60_2661 [Pseudomonadota bacterium]
MNDTISKSAHAHAYARGAQLRPCLLALAIAAAYAPAVVLAESDDVLDASLTAGIGALGGDRAERAQFGQYNGLRTTGKALVILGGDYYRRNDEAGTSVQAQGSNLLGQTREFDLLWKKQGDWKFGTAFSQGVRYEPYTVNSGLQGAGGTNPQVTLLGSAGSGGDDVLRLRRTALGLSLWNALSPSMNLQATVKTERKQGSRLSGVGMNCPSAAAISCGSGTGATTDAAVLYLPEPLDSVHNQVEARLSYAGEGLSLSTGYYGSFYNNANGSLNPVIPATLNNPAGTPLPLGSGLQGLLGQPLALAPDNLAHQFDLTGQYAVAPTTQLRMKLGYGQALQHQDYASAGLSGAPAGVSSLSGKVVTSSALLGLSTRPLPKLSVHADLRYEDKDDKTPLLPYNIEGTTTSTNRQLSSTRVRAKLQGRYQFSSVYSGSLVASSESIDRGVFTPSSSVAGLSALRQKTRESGLAADLRRSLSENVSATVGLARSERSGSNWLRDNSGLGVTEVADPNSPGSGLGATAIYMPTLADRQRDTLKLRTDWQPSDELSLQLSADTGHDRYNTPSSQGLRNSNNSQLALDAAYALSERWNLNGYVARARQTLLQSRPASYILSYTNTADSLGLGVSGKPVSKVEVGTLLSHVSDRSRYAQTLDAGASSDSVLLLAATGGLPDIVYRQTQLKLFSRYEIDKLSAARVDLVHQRVHLADWTWGYNAVPFSYSDGTTVWQKPDQAVTAISVSYTHRWQ